MWSALHLDDGTHTHAVTIPQCRAFGVGYIQRDGELSEIEAATAPRRWRRERPDHRRATVSGPRTLRLEVEPLAFGALRLEAPDGRVSHFPRAMCRVHGRATGAPGWAGSSGTGSSADAPRWAEVEPERHARATENRHDRGRARGVRRRRPAAARCERCDRQQPPPARPPFHRHIVTLVTDLELPEFDPNDPALSGERWHEAMRELRAQGSWLARAPLGVIVLDRAAGEQFLRTRAAVFPGLLLAEMFGIESGPLHEQMTRNIINLGGADHSRLRSLVNPALSPRAVERYRPAMREILLDLWSRGARRTRSTSWPRWPSRSPRG